VKVYNERTLYKEWEFVFDPTKVKPIQNPNVVQGTPGGTPASQMGSVPGSQSGMTNPDGSTFRPGNSFGGTPMPGGGPAGSPIIKQ
jgi:hypothetical protein